MNRICYMLLAAAFLAAGCTKNNCNGPIEELEIGIADTDTKVSLGTEYDKQINLLWSAGDKVYVKGDAGESVFRLKSGEGSTKGIFEYESGATGQTRITDVVYPASNAGNTPTSQTYKEGTFDPAAITLAYHNQASTSATKILLGSESSILCFQMKGNDKLNNIAVTFKNGKTYTLKTLNAPMLNESKSTPFYIVVPSQMSDRVDVKFTSSSGSMNRILSSKSFEAGKMHRFKPLEYKADKSFRIMSYNIAQCAHKLFTSSPQFTANITKELKADVAVMNEVKSSDSKKIASTNLDWQYFYQDGKTGMGNMIAYNPKTLKLIGSPTSLKLNKLESSTVKYNEDRVCLFMEFEDFILLGSHLQKDAFTKHTKLITDKVKAEYAKKGKPVFFCGDMNTRPYAVELKNFTSEWRALSRMDLSTFYNPDQPDNLICIDYIFLWKGGPDVNVTKTEVCKSVQCGTITDASDHFPIYVDVTVGNSSLPLLEEDVSLGSYSVVAEDYQ